MNRRRFHAGDRVLVRSPQEILSTLDADGTLDGVPFMPEMLDWCGKPFRVARRVEKICVAVVRPVLPNRRFAADDVVILEGPRCDGGGHDGCKRGCRILWRAAWLHPMDAVPTAPQSSGVALDELRARLKTKADENHYFCQSTELLGATEPFPGKQRPWMVRIVFREILNGDLSVPAVLKMVALWSWQRLRREVGGERWLRGPHKQTPSTSLDLKPGEAVRIKSRAQIVETLDDKRRNRGMGICYEVTRCCGGEAEVRFRVDRIIDERTGVMRTISDTVTLQKLRSDETLCEECLCYDQLGDCPRGDLMFWREIWLERAEGGSDSRVPGD